MYNFYGKHILAELSDISVELINDINMLTLTLEKLILKSGATLIETKYYQFPSNGYTLFCILAESHVSIHTYPEYSALFLDVFTCGHNINPLIIANGLCDYLLPGKKRIRQIERNAPENL